MRAVFTLLFIWFHFQSMQAQEVIKMIKVKNQPIIIGEVNGKKAYFLIDTGSDVTILNSKDTKRLRIDWREVNSKGYKLSGLNSEQTGNFRIAYQTDLKLGGIPIQGKYYVFDLTNLVRSISQDTGIRINGIIGSDIMKRYNFLIDYQSREVSINARSK